MAEKKIKLTKRSVDTIEPIPGKQFLVWDEELANFGLCVSNRGAGPAVMTYFYYYRDSMGKGHRPTIGKHGALTPEEARQIGVDIRRDPPAELAFVDIPHPLVVNSPHLLAHDVTQDAVRGRHPELQEDRAKPEAPCLVTISS